MSIFFEAQSGIIRTEKPAVTNFYQYELPETARPFLDDAVYHASVGPSGFAYEGSFLALLAKLELNHRRASNRSALDRKW